VEKLVNLIITQAINLHLSQLLFWKNSAKNLKLQATYIGSRNTANAKA
jgi:hypothetical protein